MFATARASPSSLRHFPMAYRFYIDYQLNILCKTCTCHYLLEQLAVRRFASCFLSFHGSVVRAPSTMRLPLILASSLLLIAAILVSLSSSNESSSSVSLVDVQQNGQSHYSVFSNLAASTVKSPAKSGEQRAASSSSSSFDPAALFSKPNDVHASSMLVKTHPGEKLNLTPARRVKVPALKSSSLSGPQLLRAASELARSRAASLYPANKAAKPDAFDGVKDWLIETIPQVFHASCFCPTLLSLSPHSHMFAFCTARRSRFQRQQRA